MLSVAALKHHAGGKRSKTHPTFVGKRSKTHPSFIGKRSKLMPFFIGKRSNPIGFAVFVIRIKNGVVGDIEDIAGRGNSDDL